MTIHTVAKFELSLWRRNPAGPVVLLATCLLLLLALFFGSQNQRQRTDGIASERSAFAEERVRFRAAVADHEKRGDPGSSADCTQPCIYEGLPYKIRTVATLPPHALSHLMILPEGIHPDKALIKQYISLVPNAFGEMFDERYIYSSVVVALGRLDPSFVLIWVLPLLTIATSYNILSDEREDGTLPLLLSQPLSLLAILAGKSLARGLLVLVPLVILAVAAPLLSAHPYIADDWQRLAILSAAVALYASFWILICVLANLVVKTSPAALGLAGGVWMLLVVVAPQQFRMFQSTQDPPPSRIRLMNELRAIGQDAKIDEDRVWNDFLNQHPEFESGKKAKVLLSTQRSYAMVLFGERSAEPLVARHQAQQEERRARQDEWNLLSPAMLLGRIVENLSGQSPERYAAFRQQAIAFRNEWRRPMALRMFQGRHLRADEFQTLPDFVFKEEDFASLWLRVRTQLVKMCVWLFPLLAMIFALLRKGRTSV